MRSPRVDVERDGGRGGGVVLQAVEEPTVVVADAAEDGDQEAAVTGLGEPRGVEVGRVLDLDDCQRLQQGSGVHGGRPRSATPCPGPLPMR